MWYNENWHKEVSSVDVVDKKWRDIAWVKEEDIRRQAIEYLNREENRKLPPHEFNSLVFRIKEYLRKVDNDRSVIDHKFEWLRRWIVAEIRASKNTLRREIDSRNIDEISKIRNPWDLSRYIDQSWDKALITLKEVLGTDNILSLAWLWLSYGTIELWRWLADILKLWEEFVKAYDDLKNWDFMAKDKLKLILKTLGIEWLRLLCVIPFGRAVVWRIKIFLQEWKNLWKQEKVALIGQEILEKYKKTIDLWEKVLWRKLNLLEKSVIIRAHEIWTPINWKYDYKDIDKKYRLLRTVFDENQSRKLIENRVCGNVDVKPTLFKEKKHFFDKLTPKKQEVLLKTEFWLSWSLEKITGYIRNWETSKLNVEIWKVLNRTELLTDYILTTWIDSGNIWRINNSLENLNRILENKTVIDLIKQDKVKLNLWKDVMWDLRRELVQLNKKFSHENVNNFELNSVLIWKVNISDFDKNWNNLITKF